MDSSRKANRETNEKTLQYKSRQQSVLDEELSGDKLAQLLAFINRLERTPPGKSELERRTKLFGECLRIEGESSGQYYGRLRQWLDRDLPETRLSRHARRNEDI